AQFNRHERVCIKVQYECEYVCVCARGYGRPRTVPPDLPSILLDAWIVYLGMPSYVYVLLCPFLLQIVPPDTELFIWDASKNCSKQIIIMPTYLRERKCHLLYIFLVVFLSLIYLYFISNVFNINMYLKIIY
ncbi:unnamed protein product, partial [Musa acuminata subsp. burmannicoides]